MPAAKFTDAEVIALRARKARGETVIVKDEADRFGCSVECIRRALRGDTFRHLIREVPSAPVVIPTAEDAELSLMRFLSAVKKPEETLEDPDADIAAILGYR